MSVCSNCKQETTRLRTTWKEDGTCFHQCPHCAPESFEKFTAPSDKKIWMGYEAHPNEYVKAEDGGYDRKPEYRSEQEQKLGEPTEEEKELQRRAEEKKRNERRITPMNEAELAAATRRAEEIASFLIASAEQGRDVN
jgi:hypothetical protein